MPKRSKKKEKKKSKKSKKPKVSTWTGFQDTTMVEDLDYCTSFDMELEKYPEARTYHDVPNTKNLKTRFTKMRTLVEKAAGGEEHFKAYLKFGFPEAFEEEVESESSKANETLMKILSVCETQK